MERNSPLKLKRTIVTGGTGFIGANLARRLIRDGHDVHLLVRPGYTTWRVEGIRKDVHLHEVNIADEKALTRVVKSIRPEWIFHLAAHGAYSWQTDLDAIVQTNFLGAINLVNACLATGFEAFVNSGTSSEYGFKDHAPSETDWLEPNSYYAVTKASASLFCRYVAQSKGVNIRTLRLYSIYGPYEEPNRLMPALILHGLHGAFPPLASPGIARDYVYVDDAIDAYLLTATSSDPEKGACYNVGTGVQTPLSEVVEIARRVLDISAEPEWGSMQDRIWDTNAWVSDSRKVGEKLGWKPKGSFEEGFRLMVDWFRRDPEMREFYWRSLGKTP